MLVFCCTGSTARTPRLSTRHCQLHDTVCIEYECIVNRKFVLSSNIFWRLNNRKAVISRFTAPSSSQQNDTQVSPHGVVAGTSCTDVLSH